MNLGRASHAFLYAVCLVWDLLIGWPFILLVRLFWGEDLRWENRRNHFPTVDGEPAPGGPVLFVTLREGSWPVDPDAFLGGWYLIKEDNQKASHPRSWGGTTLGHAVMVGPGRTSPGKWAPLEEHEAGVHVEQFEASMLQAFMVAIAVVLVGLLAGQSTASVVILGLVIWFTGFLQMLTSRWITAWLRGEDPYRGSAHEEAAYAVDELYERTYGPEGK